MIADGFKVEQQNERRNILAMFRRINQVATDYDDTCNYAGGEHSRIRIDFPYACNEKTYEGREN
jgi:hypothetical protein